jgi:CHAT domain-containing protein
MPKKEINDYVFYKIVCLDDSVELCYVGSTANWKARNNKHKNTCNNENSKQYNYKIYKTIRENGGWNNFKMIEIGKKDQLTKREAEQIEEEYRVKFKANMNDQRCFLTDEQKRERDKEYHKEWHKEYYQANIEKIKEYKKEHYLANLEKNKEYRLANREKRNECSKKHYLANREKINEYYSEKIVCECGCKIRRGSLAKHRRSDKHKQIMENK